MNNENYVWHLAHCPFCGKGLFWIRLLDLLLHVITFGKRSLLRSLPNGWDAHIGCYVSYINGDK